MRGARKRMHSAAARQANYMATWALSLERGTMTDQMAGRLSSSCVWQRQRRPGIWSPHQSVFFPYTALKGWEQAWRAEVLGGMPVTVRVWRGGVGVEEQLCDIPPYGFAGWSPLCRWE